LRAEGFAASDLREQRGEVSKREEKTQSRADESNSQEESSDLLRELISIHHSIPMAVRWRRREMRMVVL
jgi:hypothetical protein